MKSNVLKFVFFYLVISFSLKAQNRLILEAPSVQTSLKTGVLEQIEQYELFELNTQALHTFARNRTKDTFGVRIRFSDTHDWDIILQPAKVHDSDFKFMMSTGEIVEAEKNITYEGYLKNDQKTKVRMTISDNYVFGLILDADRYVFETVNRTPNRTTNDLVTVYKSNLLVAGSPACGRLPETQMRENENLNTMPLNSPSSPTEPLVSNPVSPVVAANLLASTYCVKLGITLDWQGLAVAGGSVAKFNADLQTIINVVNGYYAVFNVKYELNPAYIITASPNPWKDAPGNESQLTTNFLGWAFPNLTPKNYNCALLFTGTNMNGISYAYYGQMCPSSS